MICSVGKNQKELPLVVLIVSVGGPQPHTNTQHIKWIITPLLMLLYSFPARASSLMLLLLALPTLTSVILSPIWLYFAQRHIGSNLNQLLFSTKLSWPTTNRYSFNPVQFYQFWKDCRWIKGRWPRIATWDKLFGVSCVSEFNVAM